LVTARLAAKAGAKFVLAARSEDALCHLTDEITQAGGYAAYVVADVSKPEDMRRLAQEAARRFGGYDTWINNAGVSIYGKMEDDALSKSTRLIP
jgi:short-subunit dehydrogenase